MKLKCIAIVIVSSFLFAGLSYAEKSESVLSGKEGVVDYSAVPAKGVAGTIAGKEAVDNIIAIKNNMEEQRRAIPAEPVIVKIPKDVNVDDKEFKLSTRPVPPIEVIADDKTAGLKKYPANPVIVKIPNNGNVDEALKPSIVNEPAVANVHYPAPELTIYKNGVTMTSTISVTKIEEPVVNAVVRESGAKVRAQETDNQIMKRRISEKRKDMLKALEGPEDRENN
jgi:hypothetical protein